MMKKKLMTIGLLMAFAGALTACGQEKPVETVPMETIVVTTAPAETEPALPESAFANLEALVGMDKAQAADALGGGEENWTEDKSTFIGHIYQITLRDQSVKVFTSYNSDNAVASVSAWVTDGSREVAEDEVQAWIQALTEYTLSEPDFDGTSSEAGSQNWKWKKDGNFITLRWLGDIVTIDIQPAIGELK